MESTISTYELNQSGSDEQVALLGSPALFHFRCYHVPSAAARNQWFRDLRKGTVKIIDSDAPIQGILQVKRTPKINELC